MVSILLFSHVSLYSLLIFLNPHAPSLVSVGFVEAEPQHMAAQRYVVTDSLLITLFHVHTFLKDLMFISVK